MVMERDRHSVFQSRQFDSLFNIFNDLAPGRRRTAQLDLSPRKCTGLTEHGKW
jgi:hypothetical protein